MLLKCKICDLRHFVFNSDFKQIKKHLKSILRPFLGDLRHYLVINKC